MVELRMMFKNAARHFMRFLFLAFILVIGCQISPAKARNVPIIQIDKTTHSFSSVFEGDELRHTFTVYNRGSADLKINKTTHS